MCKGYLRVIQFRVDADLKLVCVKPSGTVSVPEILDYMSKLAKEPGFTPDIDEFIDTSLIDDFQATTAQMRSLLSKYKETGMHVAGRTAIAAISDLTYGMGRSLETQAGNLGMGRQIMLFRSVAEAEEYLGKKFLFDED